MKFDLLLLLLLLLVCCLLLEGAPIDKKYLLNLCEREKMRLAACN